MTEADALRTLASSALEEGADFNASAHPLVALCALISLSGRLDECENIDDLQAAGRESLWMLGDMISQQQLEDECNRLLTDFQMELASKMASAIKRRSESYKWN